MKAPKDTHGTDEITCPYCGTEVSDSWELDYDEGDLDCECCGKQFHYVRNTTVSYSSERDCQLNGQEHEWVFARKLRIATLNSCENCDLQQFVRKDKDKH